MEGKRIFEAIPMVMQDIGHISKDRENKQQGFRFRGVDQVMNTLKPILSKHGVFIVPEILETQREERRTQKGGTLIYTIHKIKYHFCSTDGSEVCCVVTGEGMDSADKSSNKAMAVAFKYAAFQVFCIPTEEMAKDDPDAYSPEESYPVETEETIEYYIGNCETKQDLAVLCAGYGSWIKSNQRLMDKYQEKKSKILNKQTEQSKEREQQ